MTIVTSAQISGLVSTQQASFYNDSLMAQHIAGQTGGPLGPPQSPPMQSAASMAPAAIAGIGGAAPGLAMTAGMAGSMAGGAFAGLGVLDPFGMAMSGASLGYGMAGGGALGIAGGAIGAGAFALPAVAGYAAMQHVTSNVSGGMQEHIGMKSMMQDQFRFSSPGGRGFDLGQVSQIEQMVRAVDKADVFTTFGEINRMIEKMNQQGMMSGVTNLQQFEQRFKSVMETTKQVARVMGTTMDQAMPFVADIRKSGFYSAEDITGQAFNRQVMGSYGFSGSQFTGVQRGGAAISQAYGGTRRAGASLATHQAQNIMQAMQMGAISEEDLMEATGGVGGAEGAAIMSQRFTQQAMRFSTTSVGRAMMLATGQMENGRYTGGIDRGQMSLLKMGVIDVGNVRSTADQRLGGGRDSRVSFVANEERMRGEFAKEAGPEMITALVRDVAGSRGFTGQSEDDVVSILMKRFTDLSRSEADLMVKISKEYDQIEKERARTMRQEMDRINDQYTRNTYQSWESTKSRIKDEFQRQTMTPELRDFGSSLQTSIERGTKEISDNMYGRYSGVITEGAANELFATGNIAAEPVSVRDLNRSNFRGSGRRGRNYARSRFGAGLMMGSQEDFDRFQRVSDALASGTPLDELALGSATQSAVSAGVRSVSEGMSQEEFLALAGKDNGVGITRAMAQTDPGREALRAVAGARGMDADRLIASQQLGSVNALQAISPYVGSFGSIAARVAGTLIGGGSVRESVQAGLQGTWLAPRAATGVSWKQMGQLAKGGSAADIVDLDSVLTQEYQRQGISIGGLSATGVTLDAAADAQNAAVKQLTKGLGGLGAREDARTVLGSQEGMSAFSGWMNTNGGTWEQFNEKFETLASDYEDSKKRGKSLGEVMGRHGMAGLSDSQAESMYKFMLTKKKQLEKLPAGEKRDKAWEKFASATQSLQGASDTFAMLHSTQAYRNAAADLGKSFDAGMGANLRSAGASDEFVESVEKYATGSGSADLRSLTGGAVDIALQMGQMSAADRARVGAELAQGGAMGYTLASAGFLAGGQGNMASDLKRVAAQSRGGGQSRKQVLEGLAASTGMNVSSLEAAMGDSSSSIGQSLNKMLAAGPNEEANIISASEQKELLTTMATGVVQGMIDAGIVEGGTGTSQDPMQSFVNSVTEATKVQEQFVKTTTEQLTKMSGSKTEDNRAGHDADAGGTSSSSGTLGGIVGAWATRKMANR